MRRAESRRKIGRRCSHPSRYTTEEKLRSQKIAYQTLNADSIHLVGGEWRISLYICSTKTLQPLYQKNSEFCTNHNSSIALWVPDLKNCWSNKFSFYFWFTNAMLWFLENISYLCDHFAVPLLSFTVRMGKFFYATQRD